MRRALPISLAIAVAVVAISLTASGLGGARNYHNDALRVRSFDTPRGWEPAPQIGYPRLLVLATHPDGARLLLGAQRIVAGTSAMSLAEEARRTLDRQRFGAVKVAADGERARLEATSDGGKGLLRQIYLVDGDLGFVVTLYAPATHQARALKDFEEAARSLQIAGGVTPSDGGNPPPVGDGSAP